MENSALIMRVPLAQAAAIFIAASGQGLGRGGGRGGGRGRGRGGGRGRGHLHGVQRGCGQRGRRHRQQRGRGRLGVDVRGRQAPSTPPVIPLPAASASLIPVPIWNGYQLIGDSIISGLGRKLVLGYDNMLVYRNHLRSKQYGLIVHGQTTSQLLKLLESPGCPPLAKEVILLIGTNDILKKVPLEISVSNLQKIMKILSQSATKVIALTIPPIPKIDASSQIMAYNSCLKGMAGEAEKNNIGVVDLYSTCIEQGAINLEFYNQKFRSGSTDLIHLSPAGLDKVVNILENNFDNTRDLMQD